MNRPRTLADALEEEVLTDLAGTFFGTRKGLEDLIEVFRLQADALRVRAAKVRSRVLFLRSLVLGPEGEAALFSALNLPPQFADVQDGPGVRPWKPDDFPFALLPSARYAKLLYAAYAEVRHACDVYMNGELENDPLRAGRKRLSPNYRLVESQCAAVNERIEKLNRDMPPSAMLQYARGIAEPEEPGQGAITNTIGAESLDKGLLFQSIDFAGLGLWKAPELPPPHDCERPLREFAATFYRGHAARLKALMAGLKS